MMRPFLLRLFVVIFVGYHFSTIFAARQKNKSFIEYYKYDYGTSSASSVKKQNSKQVSASIDRNNIVSGSRSRRPVERFQPTTDEQALKIRKVAFDIRKKNNVKRRKKLNKK